MPHPCGRREVLARLAALSALPAFGSARAQAPAPLPVARIIVSSGPGSTIDLLGRRTAEKLQPGYAQSVVVENKTGASGQLAVTTVKSAPADGSMLLLVPTPYMAIFPHTHKRLPYRPDADFLPVSLGATFDLALAVGPMVPATVRTLADFVAWCRENPARASFATPSAGSTAHFAGVLLAKAANVQFEPVNYRGPTPAVNDVLGGQIAAVIVPVGDLHSFAAAGRCRLLATMGTRRNRFVPDVPTLVEQGFKDIVVDAAFGFFLPAGTPAAQVTRASEAIRQALASPDVQKSLDQSCMEAAGSAPAALAAHVAEESRRWAPVVKSIGFTADI
jgi:tripartite-type tricarboxylate transporter receptor subunit TctC